MKQILFSLALISFISLSIQAQDKIQAIRIENPPVINGSVNEAVWEEAFLVNEFYQREPNEGAPISEKTEFYICYDDNNIYFAVKCWDNPDKITAKEMARDRTGNA